MLEDDAAGVGHVQHGAGGVRAFAGDDDGGRGLADVVVDQLQQLLEVVGVSGCGVEQQHPGGPGVVVDAAGAGGGHVGVVSLRSVDRGDGGREDLRGRGRPGRTGRVVGDPLVHGDGLLRHADAVDLDAARPRVDGQLSGEVAGEVAAVGGVAADGERGELLAVQQPGLAGVAHADGGQERVGRLDVAGVGAEVLDRDVRADVPVGLVGAAHPGRRDGGRRAQVQGQLAVRELDGRQRRHRGAPRRRPRPRGAAGPRRRTPRWRPPRRRWRSGSSRPARARAAGRRSRGPAAGCGKPARRRDRRAISSAPDSSTPPPVRPARTHGRARGSSRRLRRPGRRRRPAPSALRPAGLRGPPGAAVSGTSVSG